MFGEIKKISGILSDLGILSRSENPEVQEKAFVAAAGELWEIIKPQIPDILRDYAAQFWEQLEKLDVCNEFSLVKIDVVLASLVDMSNRYIPNEFLNSVVPHLESIRRLVDRTKILARADAILKTPQTGECWRCSCCGHENHWKTCECENCGDLSAPGKVISYHSKLFRDLAHEIQGGSL